MITDIQELVNVEKAPSLADSVRFRRESFAVLGAKVPPQIRAYDDIGSYYFLHPRDAIILCFLDINILLDDVINQISYIFDEPIESAKQHVQHTLFHFKDLLAEDGINTKSGQLRCNPADLVIPRECLDLLKRRLDAPIEINFLVSMRCPCDCRYCYAQVDRENSIQELPTTRVLELIDEACQLGIVKIVYSGGEPLLRRDISEILAYTIKRGIRTFISTKKKVSDAEAQELAATGIEVIQVSVDSLDDEIGSSLTGYPHYPQQAMSTIRAFLDAGLKVRTNSVVTPYNLLTIPHLIEYLASLEGLVHIGLAPYGRSFYKHEDGLFISLNQYRWLKEQVEKLKDRFPHVKIGIGGGEPVVRQPSLKVRRKSFPRRAMCSPFRTHLTVLPDGKVHFCEELPREHFVFGDLAKQSIKEVWDSPAITELLNPPREKYHGTACYECKDFEKCYSERGLGVCIRDALKAYGTAWGPPPTCPKAPRGALRLS